MRLLSFACALLVLLLQSSVPSFVRAQESSSSSAEEFSSSTGPDEQPTTTSSSSGPSGPVTPAGPVCIDAQTVYTDKFVCGCVVDTYQNVTTFDESTGTNVTTLVQTTLNTYPVLQNGQARLWDQNALATGYEKWDNSIESNNAASNYVDILSQLTGTGEPLTNSSLFDPTKLKDYPQCYGGGYPSGFRSNCLEQYDLAAHNEATGMSGKFFCEGAANEDVSFVKGKTSPPICIVYGGGNTLRKMRFYPLVDQFALFTLQSSFNGTEGLAQLGHFGTTFQIELNGMQSPYRHRYGQVSSFECVSDPRDPLKVCVNTNVALCTVVPFHTLVIKLKMGKMVSLEWDDDDSLCDNDHSVDGNCAIDINTCSGASTTYGKENTASNTDCDFKIYFSWSGTDSDGTYLSSSQRRLSQFRRWSIKSVYNQASQFDTKDLPTVPQEE